MKDVILKHIELNEKYHDTKERMAWIASSVYFTFSLFVLNWLFEHRNLFICCKQSFLMTIPLLFIYICALCFISLQFKMRWDSVNKAGALKEVLKKIRRDDFIASLPDKIDSELYKLEKKEKFISTNKEDENKVIIIVVHMRNMFIIFLFIILLPILILIIYIMVRKIILIRLNRINKTKHRCEIDQRYRTEIPTYVISTIFLLAQLYLIWL